LGGLSQRVTTICHEILYDSETISSSTSPLILAEKSLVADEKRWAVELEMKLEPFEHGLRSSSMTLPMMHDVVSILLG
jgi:hypothetical protein